MDVEVRVYEAVENYVLKEVNEVMKGPDIEIVEDFLEEKIIGVPNEIEGIDVIKEVGINVIHVIGAKDDVVHVVNDVDIDKI